MSERPIMQLLEDLEREGKEFRKNPAHTLPRCITCHRLTNPPDVLTDTGMGFYTDSEHLCAFCKSKRNGPNPDLKQN